MGEQMYIPVAGGVDLWVETFGERSDEACLLIPGAGANSSFWPDSLCHRLAGNGFFVIRYDHRDFGYSTKMDPQCAPYDFMLLVDDAIGILDGLGVGRAHMVGHSMGGFIVQLMAIHFPERVISITSVSSSTGSPDVPPPPPKTWEVYLANKPRNDLAADMEGFMKVWEYLNGTAPFDRELAVEYTRNLYRRQDITGALGASHVKAQESLGDRTEELKKVGVPALVIHGEEDRAVDKLGGIITAQAIPDAELKLIPGMGHMPFNHAVAALLEELIVGFISKNREAGI